MSYEYTPRPLDELRVSTDPTAILDAYRQLLDFTVPAVIIPGGSLEELDQLTVGAGLVQRAASFGVPGNDHVFDEWSFGVDRAGSQFHVDGIPEPGRPTELHHHLTTLGAGRLAVASFTMPIAHESLELYYDTGTSPVASLSQALERSLRAGRRSPRPNPTVINDLYVGELTQGDLAVIRITGSNPTIHNFETDHDAGIRGVIIRGYIQATGIKK